MSNHVPYTPGVPLGPPVVTGRPGDAVVHTPGSSWNQSTYDRGEMQRIGDFVDYVPFGQELYDAGSVLTDQLPGGRQARSALEATSAATENVLDEAAPYVPYSREAGAMLRAGARTSERAAENAAEDVYDIALDAAHDYTTPLVDIAIVAGFGLLFFGLGGATLLVGAGSTGLAGVAAGGGAVFGGSVIGTTKALGLALPLI